MYLNLAGNNSGAQGMHHVLQMLRNNRCPEESLLFNNRMGICLERCEMLTPGSSGITLKQNAPRHLHSATAQRILTSEGET